MAANNITMVDAIADMIPRLARARTSVIRLGFVTGAPASRLLPVNIGGVVTNCNYLVGTTPAVGSQVVILVTADVWLVLGQVA